MGAWPILSSEPLKVTTLQHSAGLLHPQPRRSLSLPIYVSVSLSPLSSSASPEGAQIVPHSSTQNWDVLRRKREGEVCVIPREKMNHDSSVTRKSLICHPLLISPPFTRERVPVMLLGCSERNKIPVLSFIRRIFLGIYPTQASGRQAYFITVHPPRCLK